LLPAASSCWAVGGSLDPGDPSFTSVSATSASDVWAVGSTCGAGGGCGSEDTLIVHWNGTAWSRVASPSRSNDYNSLNGVAGMSATNAWAVGSDCVFPQCYGIGAILLHWNGTAWSRIQRHGHTPAPALNAVTALSASDAWAVGTFGSGQDILILHWNGSSWSKSAG
jgi:hypothetical protein